MTVRDRVKGGVAVVRVRGDLMGGAETDEVRERVKELLSGGVKHLVLDLGGVGWMNSNGMGMLMACYSSTQRYQGRMVLTGTSPKVQQLMGITRIDRLFDHFDSVKSAERSFEAKS